MSSNSSSPERASYNAEHADAIIRINRLSKKYKTAEEYSVNELTLEIQKGQIYGLLGPNGAGKTTLISMLCGLLKPTSGDFTIDGLSNLADAEEIRKIIGVVPQEYALYPSLTAKENLMYFGSMYGVENLETKVERNLEHLGLLKYANKQMETFSGGMKRRVNLIAGLLHQPKLLFLDEPTVGVDIQSKNVIIDYLKECNQNGTTLIYTSHHLIEAQEFCTQVAIMDSGRILTKGSPKQLISGTANARNLEDVFLSLVGKELRDYA
jgi:ABC-2 type transport system ATP-binding protein